MLDDSRDYLECAQRLSVSACFSAPENPPARGMSLAEFLKADRCFYRLNRPLVLPLLLKLLGSTEAYNLFQNVVRVLAWVLLGFSVLHLGLHPALKATLLLLVARSWTSWQPSRPSSCWRRSAAGLPGGGHELTRLARFMSSRTSATIIG